MHSSDNDILSQIPEEEDEVNEHERKIKADIYRLRKGCVKEEVKQIEFQDLYSRRKQQTSNLRMELANVRIKQGFMKNFLQVLNENVKQQKRVISKFASLDLKNVLSYHEVLCQQTLQESIEGIKEAQNELNVMKEKINSLDIAKKFKEKQRICMEKEKELHRAKVDNESELKITDTEIKRYKSEQKNLIIVLIGGEKETRKFKEEIAGLNQRIAAETKEREDKQMNIKSLEDEIQEMGKGLQVVAENEEIDKYLNISAIEHVDIFKVPLNSLIKRKPGVAQTRTVGLGIETFLADIKKSIELQEQSTADNSEIMSADEINPSDWNAQANTEVASISASCISVTESGDQDVSSISVECTKKRIIVLENIVIKSANTVNPDDSSGVEEVLDVKKQKYVELPESDPQGNTENSRQICSDSAEMVLSGQQQIARQDPKPGVPDKTGIAQVQRTTARHEHSPQQNEAQGQIGNVSQVLQKVEDYLAATSPSNKGREKRKYSERLISQTRPSRKADLRQPDLTFNVSESEVLPQNQLKKLKQNKPEPSGSGTSRKMLQSKLPTDRKPKALESFNIQSCLLSEVEPFQDVRSLNPDPQGEVTASAHKSATRARQARDSQENQCEKTSSKKSSGHKFTDFFENLYDANESGGFEFNENMEMNFDAWSKTGEDEGVDSADFSIEMDMAGDFDSSDQCDD